MIEKEVRGVLVDLDISYALDAAPGEAGEAIDLEPLRRRWKSIREEGFETIFGDEVETGIAPEDDAIMFDTKVEHDHVTALA